PWRAAGGVAVLVAAGCAAAAGLALGPGAALHHTLALLAALTAAQLLLGHCVRRFGGVTGDVFGALAETATTTALIVAALGTS
ncbi:adenosylcobinamide-GDP ribazoletransferase, partial [Streptomyces sp. YS-3]|uniref:adenosylcobinamide-GDP ribazoletransferase n=1 Tax=Streptomyces sp. YS-3 TaxID=3381352 RepID=UPI00386255A7